MLPLYYSGSMPGMKVSVSLPEEDVEFLDSYAKSNRFESRSAVLQKAVRLLRAADLGAEYEEAWQHWEESGDAEAWDAVIVDGSADAPR